MIGGRDQWRAMYPASYCPCEGFNSSVHGAVLKYGFEHDPLGQSGLIYTKAGFGWDEVWNMTSRIFSVCS